MGWGALLALLWLQNDMSDWVGEDYYTFFGLLAFMGMAAYVNLYILIPRYLFLKNYRSYAGFVSFLVLVTAFITSLWIRTDDHIDFLSRFIVNGIIIVFALLITSGSSFLMEYIKKMMKIKEIENKQLRDELALLKAQVHPHFLFNTLNNLYGLITQQQNQKASEVTLKLADLMRYLLESAKSDRVSLKKEIQFLNDYLVLEKIRLRNNADVTFQSSGLDQEIHVAPLLFIPLVENAFKHGLLTLSNESFAHFILAVQGNDLFFEAKNSIGTSPVSQAGTGIGLANLHKRLQMIYPGKHLFEIEKTETWFKATLHLQV